MYWASLLRDVAFTDYPRDLWPGKLANELSSMASYKGPKMPATVTPACLPRRFPGETMALCHSFSQNTSIGLCRSRNILRKVSITCRTITTFLQVQNGISGLQYQRQAPAQRGLAYTHVMCCIRRTTAYWY